MHEMLSPPTSAARRKATAAAAAAARFCQAAVWRARGSAALCRALTLLPQPLLLLWRKNRQHAHKV